MVKDTSSTLPELFPKTLHLSERLLKPFVGLGAASGAWEEGWE